MSKDVIPDDYDDRPVPDSVPSGTLAFKWCQHRGKRSAIHYSFKRWSYPGDYDKDELDRAIDESLAKYPEALKAFPERGTGENSQEGHGVP